MAYSKLVKSCRDYAVGYQDINQVIDNNEAQRALYDVRHGTAEVGTPWDLAGRHDDVHISRGVLRAQVVGGSYLNYVVASGCIGSAFRYGTGKWGVYIYGLSSFYAAAQLNGNKAGRVQAYFLVPAVGSTDAAQVIVSTYEISAGAFVYSDLDFNLAVWGTPY